VVVASAIAAAAIPNLFPFLDPTGHVAKLNTSGAIDTTNPFSRVLERTVALVRVAMSPEMASV
jgi:hypothetical protein